MHCLLIENWFQLFNQPTTLPSNRWPTPQLDFHVQCLDDGDLWRGRRGSTVRTEGMGCEHSSSPRQPRILVLGVSQNRLGELLYLLKNSVSSACSGCSLTSALSWTSSCCACWLLRISSAVFMVMSSRPLLASMSAVRSNLGTQSGMVDNQVAVIRFILLTWLASPAVDSALPSCVFFSSHPPPLFRDSPKTSGTPEGTGLSVNIKIQSILIRRAVIVFGLVFPQVAFVDCFTFTWTTLSSDDLIIELVNLWSALSLRLPLSFHSASPTPLVTLSLY